VAFPMQLHIYAVVVNFSGIIIVVICILFLQTIEESLLEMQFRVSPSAFFQGMVQ